MEPTQSTPSPAPAEHVPHSPGELVVQNGRSGGARKSLAAPLTLIGRAEGCHIRLGVEGVSQFHCALIAGPDGIFARDLQSQTGTLVNGEAIDTRQLREDDLLTVGPFRFRLRLSATAALPASEPTASGSMERQRELDALRIQAAAVAAQQAALTEEEARLEQRRSALDQQEKQLAAHLEDKRRQLLQIQDQVRKARAELQEQKKTYEERVGAVASDLARERHALADGQRQARRERNRLIDLRRYLKGRWHRHWMAERQTMRRAEQSLAGERLKLARDAERLQRSQGALTQERLRLNGDSELGRRQLQEAWSALHGAQKHWREELAALKADAQERARKADERHAAAACAERELEEKQRQWQGGRLHREKEAEGLENRIRNHRRKVVDQEQEVLRLEGILRARQEAIEKGEAGVAAPAIDSGTAPEAPPAVAALLPPAASQPADLDPAGPLDGRVGFLEQLAGDLADQRLHLTEECERLLQARERWQQEHAAAVTELERLTLRLHDEEKAQASRERALVVGESGMRQRLAEVIHLRHNLEGCQARLRTRVAAWESERDRLLGQIEAREQMVERRLQMVTLLRGQWKKRRRVELERMQRSLAAADALHKDYAALRDECLRRQAAVEQKERFLAEQELALEQYRLECTGQSEDSPAAEKKLERLRKRWASLAVTAERAVAQERQVLEATAAQADEHYRLAQKLTREAAAHDARQSDHQTAWEQEQALVKDKHEQMRQQLQIVKSQRDRYATHVEELRDEVDRVARVLLGDDEPATLTLGQAA